MNPKHFWKRTWSPSEEYPGCGSSGRVEKVLEYREQIARGGGECIFLRSETQLPFLVLPFFSNRDAEFPK